MLLRCVPTGTGGNVEPEIEWTLTPSTGGDPVPVEVDGRRVRVQGMELEITEAELSDSGTYTCFASHSLVTDRLNATANLTVEGNPEPLLVHNL